MVITIVDSVIRSKCSPQLLLSMQQVYSIHLISDDNFTMNFSVEE